MPTIQRGDFGPEVGNWQRFLSAQGFTGILDKPLAIDEDFGRNTQYATASYQLKEKLVEPKPGSLGALTRKHAIAQGFIPFVQARYYTVVQVHAPRKVELIVIHTMEAPENVNTAENVANWFAGTTSNKASAHYCIDSNSIVQCVRERDVAWQAAGANHNGIGIEHAGYARQGSMDWSDTYSQAMLLRSAKLVADLCMRYQIPIQRLSPDDLLAKKSGICGHVDVNAAFKKGVHYDPGGNFPWENYLKGIELIEDWNK